MPPGSAAGLEGVRVVDFGHHIAGPLAALLLAEAGADVVRVDRPGEPDPADPYLNRGKRRITLDLNSSADLATAQELVSRADVLVENFRPGVLDRFGLGAAELRTADERLIYCSLPGFAADDPLAPLAAWEGVVHAAVAGYRPLSQHWDPSGRPRATVADRDAPLYTPIPTASNFAALMGAVSVVMALLVRERTGRGQRVEVPLAEAFAEAYSTMLGMRVYENPLMGDGHMLRDLTHRCADGGLVDLSPYAKFVIPLLAAAGVADDWQAAGLIDVRARTFDLARREQIMAMFAELVASHPVAWWDEVATRAEMPVSRVRTPGEWMATAHAARSGAVLTVVDPVAGPLVLPGRAFDLADPAPAAGPRHLPDQDRPALLAELGRPASARPFVAGGAVAEPLAGVRVIDISQAVAGPTAARLLADFGADVVKVGAAVPAVTDGIVGQLHRGKRTMLVDGRSAAGARLTGELLAGADVLVTNFTPRSQARYGIDDAALRPANPRLVHCSITAYGGPGPWTDRRGYENQCNAATGMSHRYGARFGWTLYQPTPINDAATGILGAFAVAVALYARGSSGPGQRVGASLAQASTLHQATLLTAEAQGQTPDAGRTEYGTSALSRLYAGSDGWFFLAARDGDLPALLAATDLAGPPASAEPSGDVPAGRAGGSARDPGPGAAGDPAGELAGRLAERFGGRPVRHWVERLGAAGIAAHRVATIDEAVEYLAGRGVVYREPGPTGADVPRPGVGRWLSETPPRVRANPGAPGSQVVELLTEHGISAAAIQELADADVVRLPDRLPAVARLT